MTTHLIWNGEILKDDRVESLFRLSDIKQRDAIDFFTLQPFRHKQNQPDNPTKNFIPFHPIAPPIVIPIIQNKTYEHMYFINAHNDNIIDFDGMLDRGLFEDISER